MWANGPDAMRRVLPMSCGLLPTYCPMGGRGVHDFSDRIRKRAGPVRRVSAAPALPFFLFQILVAGGERLLLVRWIGIGRCRRLRFECVGLLEQCFPLGV